LGERVNGRQNDEPEGYWTKHYQSAYLEDAANPKYPNAIRVAFLAYGTHKANGHARFKQREVAAVLGAVDKVGTFEPASKYVVDRAIKTAIAYGLLAPESKALCLVVPGHRIRGHQGDPETPCSRHRKPARKASSTPRLRAVR
jgi:hypothetical protein